MTKGELEQAREAYQKAAEWFHRERTGEPHPTELLAYNLSATEYREAAVALVPLLEAEVARLTAERDAAVGALKPFAAINIRYLDEANEGYRGDALDWINNCADANIIDSIDGYFDEAGRVYAKLHAARTDTEAT